MNELQKAKNKVVGEIVMIKLSELCPNRSQPRREFDDEALRSLAESIRENGILQPVCVRKMGAGYEIISGERRVRAAKLIGLSEIPCIIMNADDEQTAVLALIENIQRKDLSFFEEALAIEKLISCYGLTQEEAAVRLGKAQSTIANKLRLLRLSDAERRMIVTGGLTERQARAVVRISDDRIRCSVIEKIIREKLSIEQTEALVNKVLSGENIPARGRSKFSNVGRMPAVMYMNSLNALLKKIKSENVDCEFTADKNDEYMEYTIKFPIQYAETI